MKTLVFLLALFASAASMAQEKIYVQNPAVFIEGASINDAVRQECGIEHYLGVLTFQYISGVTGNAISSADKTPPDNAALVTLSILSVRGNAGTGITGGKGMTVRADYVVDGKVEATKTLSISSHGGFFTGMYKGTCKILEQDAAVIAKQISIWFGKVRAQSRTAQTGAASAGLPDNTIYLISPIEYVDANNIRQAIQDECALPRVTEAYILERANYEHHPIKPVSTYEGTGTAMRVSIMESFGSGGGVLAGEKAIKMHVDLLKDGKLISSKEFERSTKGGGLMSGSCQVLEQLIKSFSILSVRWAMDEFGIESAPQRGRKSKRSHTPSNTGEQPVPASVTGSTAG